MIKTLIIYIVLILLLSCGSKKILTKYYTLTEFSSQTDTVLLQHSKNHIPHSVYIQRIGVAIPYSDNTIALRTATNELQYYVYHKWAEKPASAIRHYIWQTIKSRYIFKACDISLYQLTPDLEITAYIDLLERVSIEDYHAAHLKMSLELKQTQNLEKLVSYKFDRTIQIDKSANMNIYAAAVGRILDEELIVFVDRMEKYFINK